MLSGMSGSFAGMPGADLVECGVRDLAAGRRSVEALLVSRATVRLGACGVAVPQPLPDADRELYLLLAEREGTGAHAAYNALTRRLVSFMHAAEHHARPDVDDGRVRELLAVLGRRVRAPHTLYLVGGCSAVMVGCRRSTRGVDVRPEPDSDELLRALSDLKHELDINIELTSPLDFLPALAGWRDRSPYVGTWGPLTVRHLDFRMQALAKLERGLDTDLDDVRSMLERGLVDAPELHDGFAEIERALFRHPAVDVERFRRRLVEVAGTRET